MATTPQVKTFVRTVFGIVEMALFTGVVFGWANMVLILKKEEYFKDLCADRSDNKSAVEQHEEESNDETGKCDEQDERLALIFTISVFAFNVAGFIGGSLQDKFGIRAVRLVACFLFLLAGVFSLLLKKDTANLMFPLVICLASGGMFVAITNYQIAVLHHKYKFLVSSSFSGALDSSSVVFLIFKTVHDTGADLRWIVLTYAIIAVVCVCFSTLFLLPKTSIVAEQEDSSTAKSAVELGVSNQAVTPDTAGDQQMTIKSHVDMRNGNDFDDISKLPETTENGKPNQTKSNPDLPPSSEEDKYSSGWRYILTAKYLWFLYFFCLVQLRLWFFVGSLNSYLIYYTDDDKDQIETYSESFGLAQFFGFIFAPFTGVVMDLKPRNITNAYFGPASSFIITLLLCFLLGGLVLIPVIEVQYLAFVVQVAMRAFLYASLISFVLRAFPIEHYGKLYGVCTLIGATVSLLQYPAIILIDGPGSGNPFWVNFGFFMLTFTAMGFPIYLWLSNRNTEETTSF